MGIQALSEHGRLTSDSKGKAEILNRQFESVFTDEAPLGNLPPSRTWPSMPDLTIHPEGVLKLMKNMDENKSPGPDSIPAKIIKSYADELAPALSHNFSMSLSTGKLPSDWLSANISPIFKKGNRTSAANYRPVSLTPICSKLFEHILHSNIMRHFTKHNILSHRQHGFRSHHSLRIPTTHNNS